MDDTMNGTEKIELSDRLIKLAVAAEGKAEAARAAEADYLARAETYQEACGVLDLATDTYTGDLWMDATSDMRRAFSLAQREGRRAAHYEKTATVTRGLLAKVEESLSDLQAVDGV